MIVEERGGLRLHRFESLIEAGAGHAVFSRLGGASPAPYDSLNFGLSVGDERERVMENRRRAFAAVGREPASAPDIWQIHSDTVLPVARLPRGAGIPQTDGLVSDSPADTLFLRFADCVPVLLFDPVRRVAGMAHAGWKGTVACVAARAVECMAREYGCRPADIRAGIGPAIGPDHYRVGEEVAEAVRAAFGDDARGLLLEDGEGLRFDLWKANETVLRRTGVTKIETAGLCTACRHDEWFSHRADGGDTGRFGAMIWIP